MREKYFGTNCTLTLRVYPYVQESKKLRAIIFNKDERKSLALKNGNESPIWSWNDSMEMRDLLARAGKMCDWRAVRGMCVKFRRAVWMNRMVAPLGRPASIP